MRRPRIAFNFLHLGTFNRFQTSISCFSHYLVRQFPGPYNNDRWHVHLPGSRDGWANDLDLGILALAWIKRCVCTLKLERGSQVWQATVFDACNKCVKLDIEARRSFCHHEHGSFSTCNPQGWSHNFVIGYAFPMARHIALQPGLQGDAGGTMGAARLRNSCQQALLANGLSEIGLSKKFRPCVPADLEMYQRDH